MSFIKEYFGDVIGGGKMEETTLWTNSSPTSTFAAQTVTLSDDINNYDFIKLYVRFSTSNNKTNAIIMSVSDFKNSGNTSGSLNAAFSNYYDTSAIRNRHFYYTGDTSISFGTCFNSGSSGSENTQLIPIKISGMKLVKGTGTPTATSYDLPLRVCQQATDANPYIIYGDFSKCDSLGVYGQYSTGSGYETKGSSVKTDIVLGTRYSINVAIISSQTWRRFTVYEDRIEIGSGGYGSSTGSAYGLVTKLIVGLKS